MNNKQYYLAERNNYFFGKLMTVRDFESEQAYMNSKRKLNNKMMGGSGIVSGLDVILVDNKTFSLESGMALDYMGREIVVSEPYMRRLNVIKGFEENKDKGIVYLCLAYKEELKETTFSVAGSGKSNGVSEEFNRIDEGFELFLTSQPPKSNLKLDHLINKKIEIYNENGIKISAIMKKYVNPRQCLKVTIVFEKENVEAPVNFNFNMQGEFFRGVNNEKEIPVSYQETEISTYKTYSKDYYIYCDAAADALTDIIIDRKSFLLKVGKDEIRLTEDFKLPVSITTIPIKDVVVKDYYSQNFIENIENVEDKYIYLAKFHLVSNQLDYFIESFEKHPYKQYLYSNELLGLLQELEEDLEKTPHVETTSKTTEETVPQVLDLPKVKADNIVTGVERINLGFSPKVGKSYYSYEFVHGLGEGNVAVVTAIDNKANYLTDDKGLLVFGDKGIFSKEEISISAPNVTIGAIANAKKGTVKLGVKLNEKTNAQAVDIRWWAFKPFEAKEEDDIVIDENVRVVITPNTTRIKPLEQVRFEAHIDGSINQEVRWAMAEENTGTIDNNGLYTAPSKEGVYEVKAYSVKFDGKSDSAYVVVSSAE